MLGGLADRLPASFVLCLTSKVGRSKTPIQSISAYQYHMPRLETTRAPPVDFCWGTNAQHAYRIQLR